MRRIGVVVLLVVLNACGGEGGLPMSGPLGDFPLDETMPEVETHQRALDGGAFYSPWSSSTAVDLVVGGHSSGIVFAIYRRQSDGACWGYTVDDDGTLSGSTSFDLSEVADTAQIAHFGNIQVYCAGDPNSPYTLTPLYSDAWGYVTVYAKGGNDHVTLGNNSSGGAWTIAYGGGGNDTMISNADHTQMFGSDGDDIMIITRGDGIVSMNWMNGGPGNDCLQTPGGTAWNGTRYCAEGTDKEVPTLYHATCESTASTCWP